MHYALDWIGMYCIHAELQFPLNFWNDAFYLFTVIAIVVYKKNYLMKFISDMICLNSRGKGEKINHKAKKKSLSHVLFFKGSFYLLCE